MAACPRVEIQSCGAGHGVFAVNAIAAGQCIFEFGGAVFDRAAVVAQAAVGGHDDFLQIDDDRFLGQSATADDFLNHSCSPNAWVKIERGRVRLMALADVAAGEEIVFDYGLTQVAFPFRFACLCGSPECRGEIGNYDEIPAPVFERYRAYGAIPPHVARRLRAAPRRQRAAGLSALTVAAARR
jgi:hypothetical protein